MDIWRVFRGTAAGDEKIRRKIERKSDIGRKI
jgi:hypothetical protein